MEYFRSGGGPAAYLYWSSVPTPIVVITTSQLFLPVITVPSCVANTLPANAAILTTSNTAALTWAASATATSYDVYLWSGTVVPTTPVANVSTTTYNAAALTASAQYNWYVVPKNSAGTAAGCSTNKTNFTTATAGVGLKGDYYNTNNLTGSVILSRTDTTINFNWLAASPAAVINADYFSTVWTGQVKAQYSETYTFYTNSDDGIRLWVNGQQIINNWSDHAVVENSGTIALTAGVKYDIRIEYHESTGYAVAQLLWSSISTPKAIVPKSQLFLPTTAARVMATGASSAITNTAQNSRTTNLLPTGIYPNPVVKGQPAALQINSDKAATATIQVISGTGSIMQNQVINLAQGANNRTLPTNGLLSGIYIIRITGDTDKPVSLKLLVK